MTERTRSLLTLTIALPAIMAYGSGGKPAAAQQKNPLVPDLVRNVDEPGFNPFQVRGLFSSLAIQAVWTSPSQQAKSQ
jgi:hypothetical protein